MSAILLTACDVHEWPEQPSKVEVNIRLTYDEDMTKWYHTYDGTNVVEDHLGETYDNSRTYGQIRYVVRAYPISNDGSVSRTYEQEFTFTKSIAEGYDDLLTLALAPGRYNIMVWSDLVESSSLTPFYSASDFAEVMLQGDHAANNDYRDAFRGTTEISLVADIKEQTVSTAEIAMQRPLAKYEFISNDVEEFMAKENNRIDAKTKSTDGESTSTSETRVNLDDYRVVFYYIGFMPNTYSIFTDRPVDSATGVSYESVVTRDSQSEASLGFDYVFVNGEETSVTVRIGLFDKEGTQVALSDDIVVPLKRSRHTIIRGKFMTSETSGGISINPEYDGDYNVIITN